MSANPSLVFDTGELAFARDVVEGSQEVPILVDFHSSLYPPAESPVLESLAESSGGAFRVARVDTEKEPRLASMFQVKSLPFVVAFLGGRPVDALTGARTEPEIRQFLQRMGIDPGSLGGPRLEVVTPLMQAREILRAGDWSRFSEVEEKLGSIEEDEAGHAAARRFLEARDWFLDAFPREGRASVHLQEARRQYLEGRVEAALHELLESVGEDRAFGEELARKAAVALMDLHADRKDLVDPIRRRLAGLLF